MRFLTALCTLGNGEYKIDGVTRMRARPIGDLVAALESLGSFDSLPGRISAGGCPGLRVGWWVDLHSWERVEPVPQRAAHGGTLCATQ